MCLRPKVGKRMNYDCFYADDHHLFKGDVLSSLMALACWHIGQCLRIALCPYHNHFSFSHLYFFLGPLLSSFTDIYKDRGYNLS